MQPCFLICGVSGAGKSWICRQLTDKFYYIPHDEYLKDHLYAVRNACAGSIKPVITECPFGERGLRDSLEANNIRVFPFFVVEPPSVVARRYFEREGKELPKNAMTRATTILERVQEWGAPFGASDQILAMLKAIDCSKRW